MTPKLILGSQSPRRKEILSYFSYPFQQSAPHFAEESISFSGNPEEYANLLSKGKALSLQEHFPNHAILTADTIVFRNGELFIKPTSQSKAFDMLCQLNGSWHSVFTSITIYYKNTFFTECEETKVLFHTLSEEELKQYHLAFGALDKAGGYAIQEGGGLIVKEIQGCFYNVMGLPLNATRKALMHIGINLWRYLRR